MYKILSIFPSVQFSHSTLSKDQIDNSNFRGRMILFSYVCYYQIYSTTSNAPKTIFIPVYLCTWMGFCKLKP